MSACRARAPAPPPSVARATAPPPKIEPIHAGPLTDFVPAAGLRWLVAGSPRRIMDDPALSRLAWGLLGEDGLAELTARTGLELRIAEEAAVAGYPSSTLFLAATSDPTRAERAFRARTTAEPRSRSPHPEVTALTGVIGAQPCTLVSARDRFVALSVGDPRPAWAVLGFALGRVDLPAALQGAALATLPAHPAQAPLRFYAPGPFEGEWNAGPRGLLAFATAVAVVAEAGSAGQLRLEVFVAGSFGADDWTRDRLGESWGDLADSHLGQLLGIDEPREPPVIRAEPTHVSLRVGLDVAVLVAGLRAAVLAELPEILGLDGVRGAAPTLDIHTE